MQGYIRRRRKPFPLQEQPKIKLKDHPSFLKRHSKWITVFGALIVAAMFVAKESLQLLSRRFRRHIWIGKSSNNHSSPGRSNATLRS